MQTKLSFGSQRADSKMKAGRYNIFGHESKEELERNAGLIISSFKLQILDYLAFHQDRHYENFFIDLNAKNPEDAFSGIDNDNVFGSGISKDDKGRSRSYKEQATGSYYDVETSDVATTLKGFVCIPIETQRAVENLNEEIINKAMMPYLDRASRFAVLKRVRALKKFVASEAKVVNVRTVEGMDTFRQESLDLMLRTIFARRKHKSMLLEKGARFSPSVLNRAILMSYFVQGVAPKEKNNKPGEYEYQTEFEYVPEGKSIKEYLPSKLGNLNERNESWKNVFEGLLEEAGLTRKEAWEKYAAPVVSEMNEEQFAESRELFLAGKDGYII